MAFTHQVSQISGSWPYVTAGFPKWALDESFVCPFGCIQI
jgi:hypothetical protein